MSGQASQEDQKLPSLYFYTNETCDEKVGNGCKIGLENTLY